MQCSKKRAEVLEQLQKLRSTVYLYGQTAYGVRHKLSKLPDTVEYYSTDTIELCTYVKVEYEYAYEFTPIVEMNCMTDTDLLCHSLRFGDMDLLTAEILTMDNIDPKVVRERYRKLYGVPLVRDIDKYIMNVNDSNIAQFLRKNKLKYPAFVDSAPMLCKTLECTEEHLNDAIIQLL